MSKDNGFAEYIIHDLLGFISGITCRRMFGGHGLYLNGNFFSILRDGEIYFKVDESNWADFKKFNSEQFEYQKMGKLQKLSYYKLPVEVMDDRALLRKYVEASAALIKS